MSIPSDRKYASTHEWIKADGDVMLVGITGPAQEQLGDLVFVGDVRVGAKLAAGATAALACDRPDAPRGERDGAQGLREGVWVSA